MPCTDLACGAMQCPVLTSCTVPTGNGNSNGPHGTLSHLPTYLLRDVRYSDRLGRCRPPMVPYASALRCPVLT
eukprot:1372005-Rhodomonas_salina.4